MGIFVLQHCRPNIICAGIRWMLRVVSKQEWFCVGLCAGHPQQDQPAAVGQGPVRLLLLPLRGEHGSGGLDAGGGP